MRVRRAGLALAAAFALGSCSHDARPTAPATYPRSITGTVLLVGYQVDGSGRFGGTRVQADADGIPVELAYGNTLVATTTTVAGHYHFEGLGPGAYVARTHPVAGLGDTTELLTIANVDVTVRDTLRLVSHGDLVPVPNPFVTTATIYFDVPDSQHVDIQVRDMGGNLVRVLAAEDLPAAFQGVFWNGRDEAGVPASAPLYWVTYVAGSDVRTHLLFR